MRFGASPLTNFLNPRLAYLVLSCTRGVVLHTGCSLAHGMLVCISSVGLVAGCGSGLRPTTGMLV